MSNACRRGRRCYAEVTAKQEAVPAEQKRGLQLLAAALSLVQTVQLPELNMCVLQYA